MLYQYSRQYKVYKVIVSYLTVNTRIPVNPTLLMIIIFRNKAGFCLFVVTREYP